MSTPPKVIVVDDNLLSADMLSRRLRRKGYEVLTASDGDEAIEVAEREIPDLILMDMSLPRKDGWTATRILKQGARTKGIPVIALTAHAMSGDREKALEAGCDDYDTKPVDLRRLLTKMSRFVPEPTP
ncbi:MAG: response regulator [Nannocystis sp.]|jgi:two-component system cell cycle response regulator DivK|nr:response regulator [Nannocystis sp.]